MFAAQLESAVLGADLHQLDHLSRDLWKAFNAGLICDDDAQRLAELIHDRRGVTRGFQKPVGVAPTRCSIFRPRRLQRPPLRAKAIERRRMLAGRAGFNKPSLPTGRVNGTNVLSLHRGREGGGRRGRAATVSRCCFSAAPLFAVIKRRQAQGSRPLPQDGLAIEASTFPLGGA